MAKKLQPFGNDFFKRVVFTDESSFRLSNVSGRKTVWREPNTRFKEKNVIWTEKFGGGSVMAWGYITIDGPGKLIFLEKNVNQNEYKSILEEFIFHYSMITLKKLCIAT